MITFCLFLYVFFTCNKKKCTFCGANLRFAIRKVYKPDVELNELRKMVYKMVGHELATTGGRMYRRYELSDGRKEKK